jgi:hypothetical protein
VSHLDETVKVIEKADGRMMLLIWCVARAIFNAMTCTRSG